MERKVKNVPGAVKRYNTVSGSGEPDMNRFSSHPDHENRRLFEEPPPQSLCESRGAGNFFEFFVTDPWAPCFGAAAFIVTNG